jgi:hypothetical protein
VPHLTSTPPSSVGFRPQAAARACGTPLMVRGLVNGVVLSLAVWLAAGYVAFILH